VQTDHRSATAARCKQCYDK